MFKTCVLFCFTFIMFTIEAATTSNVDGSEEANVIDLPKLLIKIDEAKPEVITVHRHLENPISGHAIVKIDNGSTISIYSFNGLIKNSDNKLKLTNQAWVATLPKPSSELELEKQLDNITWQSLPDVPSKQKQKGRYVTNATVMGDVIYLLGGYSTNRLDHAHRQPNKQNVSDFYSFDPNTNAYSGLAELPVPVDDTVIAPYQERYLYVVSGWHKDGAVNLVQVYDSYKNEWFQASPLPSAGVFGHAGGIFENQIVFCDGQQVAPNFAQAPILKIQQRCWLGEIDFINPSQITWVEWAHPSDVGKFRMATTTNYDSGDLWFIGGATDAFDLFGRSASSTDDSSAVSTPKPNNEIWRYNFKTRHWQLFSSLDPVMDTPNAILIENRLITFGGRTAQGMTNKHIIHR